MSCDTCVTFHNFYSENTYNWCTNCGNYGITAAIKRAFVELELGVKDLLLCYDIGCNGNGADKIHAYTFHGLHGRVIPFAAGASLANNKLKVIASAGDGATLSEGINHLVHAIRSDYNVTFLLHNNSNYGLTTGQASATTKQGVPMNFSPDGVTADTMNIMQFVLSLNPSFAARTFSGDVKHMTKTFKSGIEHDGFSVIEILQYCPTYNKETPHQWYQERVYDVADVKSYNRMNLESAIQTSKDLENNIAIGVLYEDINRGDFYERQKNREGIETELIDEVRKYDVSKYLATFK